MDNAIALQYQPSTALESPLNMMAKLSAIRGSQQENAMRQAQMENYRSEIEKRNAMLPYEQAKARSDQETADLTRDTKRGELVTSELARSRSLLENVRTPEQFIAWHQGNHSNQILGPWLASHGVTADQSRANIEAALQTPGGFEQLLNESKIGSEKVLESALTEQNFGGGQRQIRTPKYGTGGATEVKGSRIANTATPGEKLTDARLREQEAAGAETAMSHDAIVNAATRYNMDGTLPPLGMGKSANVTRNAVMSMAAELAKGVDPSDQRLRQISNKANAGALNAIVKQENLVGAFERNFTKNADLALGLNDKRDHSGVPLTQKWINAGRKALAGDPDLRQFDIAIKSVVNEYGKIISGSMGNTALAQGEIKRMEDRLASAQTPAEVAAVISFMKQETANRMAGFKEQKGQLTGEISGQSPASAATATPATGGGDLVAAARAELARRRGAQK